MRLPCPSTGFQVTAQDEGDSPQRAQRSQSGKKRSSSKQLLPLVRLRARGITLLSSNCRRLRRGITLTLALSHDGRGDKKAFDRLRPNVLSRGCTAPRVGHNAAQGERCRVQARCETLSKHSTVIPAKADLCITHRAGKSWHETPILPNLNSTQGNRISHRVGR